MTQGKLIEKINTSKYVTQQKNKIISNFGFQTIQKKESEEIKRKCKVLSSQAKEDLPDIYYIILDAYGRSDVLQAPMRLTIRFLLTSCRIWDSMLLTAV